MVPMTSPAPAKTPSRPILAVVGPTGTGKSALAVALAKKLGGECINADSMQFYRGMNIGTAKITPAETQGVAHHLIDIMDLTEEASVAEFQARAREVITNITNRGKYPILVGGSGLYVRAALDKLELPGTDPAVRARLEEESRAHGIGALRARLADVDPDSAAKLNDERRIIRALEVYEVTGRPFSAFMPTREYVSDTLQIGLNMDRARLHERLHNRVVAMEKAGLLAEVEQLVDRGLRQGKTASRAIGYAQFLKVLDAQTTASDPALSATYTLHDAIEDTATATRQFARRQITWFRGDDRVHWFDAESKNLLSQALEAVHQASQGCKGPKHA